MTDSPLDLTGLPQPGSIAGDAKVSIILADFASADASGKLNIIGGGWAQTARVTMPGRTGPITPPQTVVVIIELPNRHAEEQFAVALQLTDERGEVVGIANPVTGQLDPLRIQQLAHAASQAGIPQSVGMPAIANIVIGMPQGLPLEANRLYRWVFEIDGHRNPLWQTVFFVRPEATPTVLG